MALHKFGVRIEGELHTLCGSLNDADFQEATKHGLPAGWVAWHIEESELGDNPSQRVMELRNRPHLDIRWQDAMADAKAGRPIGTTGYSVTTL